MEKKNVLTISQEIQKSKLPGLEGLYGRGLQEKVKAEIDELPQRENLSICSSLFIKISVADPGTKGPYPTCKTA